MKLLTSIFIIRLFFAQGFRGLRMTADINNVVRNKFLLQPTGYNSLVNKIENHDVSKIYFSEKLDTVIAENSQDTGTMYEDYTITKINPLITSSLTDLSVKNKVETMFLVDPRPPLASILANNVLGFIEGSFFPL